MNELTAFLNGTQRAEVVDILYRQVESDKELADRFGISLMSQVRQEIEHRRPRQTASEMELTAEDWQGLTAEFLRENCLVIVGPGLTMGVDYLEVLEQIKQRLAAECDCPTDGIALEDVAQFFEQEKGRQVLENTVTTEMGQHTRPDSESLKLIASLPFAAVATTVSGPELDSVLMEAQRSVVHTTSLAETPRVDRGDLLLMQLSGSSDVPGSLVLTRQNQLRLRAALASTDSVLSG